MRQIIFRLLSFRNFVRGLDKRKAWEAGRTTFAIIGAAGRIRQLLVCDAHCHGHRIALYRHRYLVRGIPHDGA